MEKKEITLCLSGSGNVITSKRPKTRFAMGGHFTLEKRLCKGDLSGKKSGMLPIPEQGIEYAKNYFPHYFKDGELKNPDQIKKEKRARAKALGAVQAYKISEKKYIKLLNKGKIILPKDRIKPVKKTAGRPKKEEESKAFAVDIKLQTDGKLQPIPTGEQLKLPLKKPVPSKEIVIESGEPSPEHLKTLPIIGETLKIKPAIIRIRKHWLQEPV